MNALTFGILTGAQIFTPEAIDIIDAIEATDAGTQPYNKKIAINRFTKGMIGDGLWIANRPIYGYVGGTANSHAINWNDPGTFTITWNGTVTHNANGITGDGSTGYGNTGFMVDTLNPDSMAFGSYSRTNSDGLYDDMGASNPSGIEYISRLGDNAYFDLTYPAEATAASTDSRGLFMMSRAAAGVLKGYRNGTELATANVASSALPNVPVGILSGAGNAAYRSSPRNLSASIITDGQSPGNHVNIYANIQALQTALGRAV